MQPSFVESANSATAPFPLNNLPYGIFSQGSEPPRIGVAIGDHILDLSLLSSSFPTLFADPIFPSTTAEDVLSKPTLNAFLALSRPVWQHVRSILQDVLSESPVQRDLIDADEQAKQKLLPLQSAVTMHLPAHVGDYTDFYSSIAHATNVGTMFRGPENALPAAWLHMPIGYHGRASSVIVSGTPVRRPVAQLRPDPSAPPVFAPCKLFDFELEMAVLIGGAENGLGDRVSIEEAGDRVFGFMLMNDWSARDVQKWEYVPLGPFGAKNLGTSVSPWVVPLEALEPFKVGLPERKVPILPYLDGSDALRANCLYDVDLTVAIQTGSEEPSVVTKSNLKHLYWTVAQQVTHHTVTGCNLRPGDLIASGTISGEDGKFRSNFNICC